MVRIGAWPLLPGVFIIGGVLAFAGLVTTQGLVPALVTLVLLSCHDRITRRPLEVVAICSAMLLLAIGIFVYGIQIPLDLW